MFNTGGKDFNMKYINSILCVLVVLLTVISVDITPKAYELLSSYDDSGQVWISNVVYSWPGATYALVMGGLPENIEEYSVVEVKDLKVYVPKNTSTEEVVKIVDFTRRNGRVSVGVKEK